MTNSISLNCIELTITENNKENLPQKRDFRYMNSDDDSLSVISHDEDDLGNDSEKKLGRKPIVENDDDIENEEHQTKRKAQNRAAQRAFRERKEQYVKELENKIRQAQDSHHQATTYLYQENQHLRFIIYRLELELSNLKGETLNNHQGNESCLVSIGPPPDLKALLPSSSPKLASLLPLQIRPAPVESCTLKIIPNSPDKKKKKVQHEPILEDYQNVPVKKHGVKKVAKKKTSPPSTKSNTSSGTSGQEFTFAITTPSTLRESSKNELARKKEHIEAVQLYPNHSHPANYLLEKNYKTKTDITPALSPIDYSSSDSIISSSSDEEDKILNNTSQKFNDIMLLDTSVDFDFSEFANHATSSPTLTLSQLLTESSGHDWTAF